MKIIYLEEVDSTNRYLKNMEFDDSVLVFCEKQTNGYGQYERSWYKDEKDSIAFSYKYNSLFLIDETYIKKITQRFSELINSYFGINTYVKIPNDIYFNDKKLCGVLVETKYFNDKLESIIIGIGLNINNEKFPEEIKEIATSIYMETKRRYSINDFRNYLCKYFEDKIIKE